MFNLGFTEIIVLGAIALLVIGPQQLPDLARTIAKLLNEFKSATKDLSKSFTDVKKDVDSTVNEVTSQINDAVDFEKKLMDMIEDKASEPPVGTVNHGVPKPEVSLPEDNSEDGVDTGHDDIDDEADRKSGEKSE